MNTFMFTKSTTICKCLPAEPATIRSLSFFEEKIEMKRFFNEFQARFPKEKKRKENLNQVTVPVCIRI